VSRLSSALHVGLPDPLSGSWVLASIGNVATWEFVGYNTPAATAPFLPGPDLGHTDH
jgi:hypothetical protein